MSFLYKDVITLSRPNEDQAVGEQPYGGVLATDETILASGIAAHIQVDRQGTLPTAKLAADAAGQTIWKVIYFSRLAPDVARTGDIITDQDGNRYQVIAPDNGPISTTCHCQALIT